MSESNEKSNRKELYAELKELDQEIKKVNSHVETIDEQIAELQANKQILSQFSGLSAGDELRVPLVAGVYFKAELKDTKKVMVNVGANVTVEKEPLEVIDILSGQVTELTEYRANLVAQMKELIVRIEQIQKEVE
jgi:prefoldin alpha subunit